MQSINVSSKSVFCQKELNLGEGINNRVVEIIKEIVSDNEHRVNNCKENIQLLGEGCFYPNTYFRLLKDNHQQQRLDYFIKKGSFYYGYASLKHFTIVAHNHFILKNDVTPCDGLRAIRKGFTFIGCGEICQMAYYEAIKDAVGEAKFNALFSASSKTPLRFHWDSTQNPLFRLFKFRLDPNSFSKGELVSFANTQSYQKKHLIGDAQGYNAICCDPTPGQETFTTLGLASKGMTRLQISEKLLSDFNEQPKAIDTVTPELRDRLLKDLSPGIIEMTRQLKDAQMDKEEFLKTGGGAIAIGCALNVLRIDELARLSLKEAVQRFASWEFNISVGGVEGSVSGDDIEKYK